MSGEGGATDEGYALFGPMFSYEDIQEALRKLGRLPAPVPKERPSHWPLDTEPDTTTKWVWWLPQGWGQGVKTTSGGKILRCYVAPDGKRFFHKKDIEKYTGIAIPNKDPQSIPKKADMIHEAIPNWPEEGWLPGDWRLIFRSLPSGGLHRCYVPPGQDEGFLYHREQVLQYLSGENLPLTPFGSSRYMQSISAEAAEKKMEEKGTTEKVRKRPKVERRAMLPHDYRDGVPLKVVPVRAGHPGMAASLSAAGVPDSLARAAMEVVELLPPLGFERDAEHMAVFCNGKNEDVESFKLCGVYHLKPELCNDRPYYQKLVKVSGGAGGLIGTAWFLGWSSSRRCWKIGAVEDGQAGLAFCEEDQPHPGRLSKSWKVMKQQWHKAGSEAPSAAPSVASQADAPTPSSSSSAIKSSTPALQAVAQAMPIDPPPVDKESLLSLLNRKSSSSSSSSSSHEDTPGETTNGATDLKASLLVEADTPKEVPPDAKAPTGEPPSTKTQLTAQALSQAMPLDSPVDKHSSSSSSSSSSHEDTPGETANGAADTQIDIPRAKPPDIKAPPGEPPSTKTENAAQALAPFRVHRDPSPAPAAESTAQAGDSPNGKTAGNQRKRKPENGDATGGTGFDSDEVEIFTEKVWSPSDYKNCTDLANTGWPDWLPKDWLISHKYKGQQKLKIYISPLHPTRKVRRFMWRAFEVLAFVGNTNGWEVPVCLGEPAGVLRLPDDMLAPPAKMSRVQPNAGTSTETDLSFEDCVELHTEQVWTNKMIKEAVVRGSDLTGPPAHWPADITVHPGQWPSWLPPTWGVGHKWQPAGKRTVYISPEGKALMDRSAVEKDVGKELTERWVPTWPNFLPDDWAFTRKQANYGWKNIYLAPGCWRYFGSKEDVEAFLAGVKPIETSLYKGKLRGTLRFPPGTLEQAGLKYQEAEAREAVAVASKGAVKRKEKEQKEAEDDEDVLHTEEVWTYPEVIAKRGAKRSGADVKKKPKHFPKHVSVYQGTWVPWLPHDWMQGKLDGKNGSVLVGPDGSIKYNKGDVEKAIGRKLGVENENVPVWPDWLPEDWAISKKVRLKIGEKKTIYIRPQGDRFAWSKEDYDKMLIGQKCTLKIRLPDAVKAKLAART